MELQIKHIEADGIALVKFDKQTAADLIRGGHKHLLFFDNFDEETGFTKPYITNYRKTIIELDESRLEKCSARIYAAINVYFEYINNVDNGITSIKALAEAVKETAYRKNVTVSSIYDKISRQLSISSSDFRTLLEKAYNGDVSALQDILRKHAVNASDKDIIDNYLPEIYGDYTN